MRIDRFSYAVTFNGTVGDYEVGDSHECSTDYVGDDLEELVREVIQDCSPDYPLTFVAIPFGDKDRIVGLFCTEDQMEDADEIGETPYPTAIMYRPSPIR